MRRSQIDTLPKGEDVAGRIRALWELRNLGDVAAAYEGYVALCGALAVPADLNLGEKLDLLREQRVDPETVLDFLLLEPSFARNALRLEESDSQIAFIETAFSGIAVTSRYQLAFQKGVNALVRARFSVAFDQFIRSVQTARNPQERIAARYNQLLAMDRLGLDYTEPLARLKDELGEITDCEWVPFYQGKLEALVATDLFRRGDLASLARFSPLPASEDRLVYFLAWLAEHPLYPCLDSASQEGAFSRHYSRQAGRWLNGYRLRTLKGLLLAMDLGNQIEAREKIERLHLWTWRWLLDPEPALLDKIVKLGADLAGQSPEALTYEEFQMWENAVRWLALFSSTGDETARGSLRGASYSLGRSVTLLEYERLALDVFFALRNAESSVAEDTFRALGMLPAHSARGFLLPSLVKSRFGEEAIPGGWKGLATNLSELFPKQARELRSGILVNVREGRVRRVENGQLKGELLSEALTSLLVLLRETRCVTKAEALQIGYGIGRYDGFLHDPKIANLISRANKLLRPHVGLVTKGANLMASAWDARKIVFECYSRHSLLLSRQREPLFVPLAPLHGGGGGGRETEKFAQFAEHWRSREEFEALLRVSKATAQRRIQRWMKENMLVKEGEGRASRYKFLPQFVETFTSEARQK